MDWGIGRDLNFLFELQQQNRMVKIPKKILLSEIYWSTSKKRVNDTRNCCAHYNNILLRHFDKKSRVKKKTFFFLFILAQG